MTFSNGTSTTLSSFWSCWRLHFIANGDISLIPVSSFCPFERFSTSSLFGMQLIETTHERIVISSSTTNMLVLLSFFCTVLVVPIFISLMYYVLKTHNAHFGGKRLSRNDRMSPSSCHYDPPNVQSWHLHNQHGYIERQLPANNELHPDLFTPIAPTNTTTNHSFQNTGENQRQRAKGLNMDHVYMAYFELLWAFIFVGPFSYFLWKKATIMLKIRIFLVKVGLSEKTPVDIDVLVGKLVLEQSQVIHYVSKTNMRSKKKIHLHRENKIKNGNGNENENENVNVATFVFPNFPYVDKKGKFQTANFLSVDINLDLKRFVACKMDGDKLNASETLILLWYNTISAQHVKIHALGNWGVNIDDDIKKDNPFLQRNSIVSVVYNYFGFTSFPTYMEEWKREGLLSKDWDPQALTDTFIHGVQENICQHSHVTDLSSHSDFVNFIVKTRSIFHCEFAKHKDMFPGVHPEGLFAGTVLHSLDHQLMEWNLEDPLWLDVDDPRFGKMAELGRIVRVGFVPEVRGYYFHRYFRNSGHPFYESVYAKAEKIDKRMADSMETCICR